MFVQTQGRRKYVVRFDHGSDSSLYPGCIVPVTECKVLRVIGVDHTSKPPHLLMTPVPSASGRAVCHPGDLFEKEEGRKRSLARALKASGFKKPTRTKFWEAYFKLTQPKPQAK